MSQFCTAAFLTAVLLLLPACASHGEPAEPGPALQRDLAGRARVVRAFDGSTGEPVLWADLVQRAASADAVIIGENHGHPLGLAAAAALWEDLLALAPNAALSMEFFERDEQLALDDYLGGLTNATQFLAASGRNDGNYPPGHRQMVESAKLAGRPVIAANAPRRYVRLARLEGFDRLRALTEEQRRTFRIPDELAAGRYRTDFDAIMTSDRRPGDPEPTPEAAAEAAARRDGLFRSQQVWDWTMAESVARASDRGLRPVVHVVGRFHSDHRGGTAQAIEKLRPGTRVLVVSMAPSWAEALAEEDKDRADLVLYVGPQPAEQ